MGLKERYYDYWGLVKAPFDDVPDPGMYFDLHTSMENAIAETLFAIEEGNECLIVIVGEGGYGKTMTLRVVLDSLKQERYRVAFVPNPDMTFRQLLREIIGQLTGEACAESKRNKLLEIFNQLLLKTTAKGKRVLIFIDDANTMKPTSLERLRLLTDMQGDNDNLFTIVMAGQRDLTRRLEHPQCANLFHHIGVYCQLTKIESRDLMRHYIEYRLERAGTSRRLFSEQAYDAIWQCSENGIPRLINNVAKLALKAGQAGGVPVIDGAIVQHVSSRLDDTAKAMSPKREEQGRDEPRGLRDAPSRPAISKTRSAAESLASAPSLAAAVKPLHRETRPPTLSIPSPEPRMSCCLQDQQVAMADVITFPEHGYRKVKGLPTEQRFNLAGQLAVEVLNRYSHLIQQLGSTNDPVPAWTILRNVIARQLEQHLPNEPATIEQGLPQNSCDCNARLGNP